VFAYVASNFGLFMFPLFINLYNGISISCEFLINVYLRKVLGYKTKLILFSIDMKPGLFPSGKNMKVD
jgi:hypothetical protein